MPAIPVYSSSPINASKASGVTPKTAGEEAAKRSIPVSTEAEDGYPQAMPGATPSLPAPTGASQHHPQPTPTQRIVDPGPPAPQPGAVPAPDSTRLPPPPKAGEQPPQITSMPMPPQMSYPAPTASHSAYGGSSTFVPAPIHPVASGAGSNDLAHPPGYQQDIHATELNSNQRAAHNASAAENYSEQGEGVWDAAKKWALAAGESLAAAEGEVWKRINKE